MDDLSIIKMNRPIAGDIDAYGEQKEIEVELKNESDIINYKGTKITAQIILSNGIIHQTLTENLPEIDYKSTQDFTFSNKYTVPNTSVYYIKVFVESKDFYPENDTLPLVELHAEDIVGIKTLKSVQFTLEQNVPNPTNDITTIGYTIPEQGEVTFNVHAPNGQLLYNKVIQSELGRNTIELNTDNFAAGIYLYSIEYKGQRLIKRMSVKK